GPALLHTWEEGSDFQGPITYLLGVPARRLQPFSPLVLLLVQPQIHPFPLAVRQTWRETRFVTWSPGNSVHRIGIVHISFNEPLCVSLSRLLLPGLGHRVVRSSRLTTGLSQWTVSTAELSCLFRNPSGLYNHIQLSSNLMSGCDYSLFKDGVEPMWEDEKNKRGGRWLITLNKQQRRNDLDRFWLETLMCLIGESFDEYSEDVCGAVVNVRAKGDKIAIWTTECENKDAVTHIGRVYKERLGLPPKVVLGYQSHADTATKSGSTTKNRFVV
uniref:Eukaryotic translation initiation factor 4E n=1 Tax=Leptobrachium leishanense TaxID=445787 RepID=A0A8C5PD44_9ANUR